MLAFSRAVYRILDTTTFLRKVCKETDLPNKNHLGKTADSMAFLFYEMLLNILHINGLDFVKHNASSRQITIFATVFGQDLRDFHDSVILFEGTKS